MTQTGDMTNKPGWIRMSIHPTTTNDEIEYICNAIKNLAENHKTWANDYSYNPKTNEFKHKNVNSNAVSVEKWFDI